MDVPAYPIEGMTLCDAFRLDRYRFSQKVRKFMCLLEIYLIACAAGVKAYHSITKHYGICLGASIAHMCSVKVTATLQAELSLRGGTVHASAYVTSQHFEHMDYHFAQTRVHCRYIYFYPKR